MQPGVDILLISGYPLETSGDSLFSDFNKLRLDRIFFLQKPFSGNALGEELTKILSSRPVKKS